MTTNVRPEVLEAAADYIDEHGWYQGYFFPMNIVSSGETSGTVPEVARYIAYAYGAPMCTMGAIATQVEDIDEYGRTHDFLARALAGPSAIVITSIPDWNDAPNRTKGEVVDFLRMTALKIRMGDIGDNPKEYEFEPMPTTEPVKEPAAHEPAKEPVPA